jgi:hypothetical protein
MSEKKIMSPEALAEIEAMCKTAVSRSPGDFLIGQYQDNAIEDAPQYNLFLKATLVGKKREKKRIVRV